MPRNTRFAPSSLDRLIQGRLARGEVQEREMTQRPAIDLRVTERLRSRVLENFADLIYDWRTDTIGRAPNRSFSLPAYTWESFDAYYATYSTGAGSLTWARETQHSLHEDVTRFQLLREEVRMKTLAEQSEDFKLRRARAIANWNKFFPIRVMRPPKEVTDPHYKVPRYEESKALVPYKPRTNVPMYDFQHLTNILANFRENWKSYDLPEIITLAYRRHGPPHDWHLLALEQPRAASDPNMIAYNSNEVKRLKGVATVTSPGKYLRRHWTRLKDEEIRDLVALTATGMELIFRNDQLIESVNEGPRSCMTDREGDRAEFEEGHPYEAYAEKFGWHGARRLHGGRIDGRVVCLTVNKDTQPFVFNEQGEMKLYVRTYARAPNDGYSEADHALEAWLNSQGYKKTKGYPEGTLLLRLDRAAPYLDGPNSESRRCTASHHNGVAVWRVDSCGKAMLDCTDGRYSSCSTYCSCCGDAIDEDDDEYYSDYGIAQDQFVCGRCADRHFVSVYGPNEIEYMVDGRHYDYVTYNDEHYLTDYLSDYDLCLDVNGDARSLDDVIKNHHGDYVDRDEVLLFNDHAGSEDFEGDWIEISEEEGEVWRTVACRWVAREQRWMHENDVTWVERLEQYVPSGDVVSVDGDDYVINEEAVWDYDRAYWVLKPGINAATERVAETNLES